MRTTTSDRTIQYMKDGVYSPEMSYEQFAKADIDLREVSHIVHKYYLTREEAEKFRAEYKDPNLTGGKE